MSLWSIIWFIVTNIPALVRLVKELIHLFEGDKKAVSECLSCVPQMARESLLRNVGGNING